MIDENDHQNQNRETMCPCLSLNHALPAWRNCDSKQEHGLDSIQGTDYIATQI